jgi:hypothetical protein
METQTDNFAGAYAFSSFGINPADGLIGGHSEVTALEFSAESETVSPLLALQ